VTEDIRRLCESGISNLNLDLIAGLPHQTSASWEFSLEQAIATGVPHLSVYMLEVDQDSRLGREVLAGGTRYHAHFVPDDDLTSDFYVAACEKLNTAGVQQYEISNFARPGFESKHNLKYWTRQPYMGFGVDAHSMLYSRMGGSVSPHPAAVQPGPGRLAGKAIRFANPESLDEFLRAAPLRVTPVSIEAAMEETFFLGLRLNRGLELAQIDLCFGREALAACGGVIAELREQGLLDQTGSTIRLSARGRLLSNEVFEAFLALTSR
jgi:oxygen-independent coproporphyrinogen-3 oxidase